MRIVEIIPQLNSGGAERFTVDLCNKLSQNNNVTLIILHPLNNTNFYLNELSPNILVISANKKKGFDIRLFFKLKKIIKNIKPDIVHTHLRAIVYIIWSVFSLRRDLKFFHTVHNDAEKEAGEWFSVFVRRFTFKYKFITPVTISPESQQSFIQFYRVKPILIFNGRDINSNLTISQTVKNEFQEYKKSKNTKVLVNLARIDPVKRQPMLAKIVSRLTTENYDFTLLIIGSTKNKTLVNEIKSYKCPNIYVLGEKKNPLEYLKMADAFCLCSSYEGMPISLIEALGTGTVPICTPVGGIVDVIQNGVNGFLSKNISEEAYYEKLKYFLELPEESISELKNKTQKSYPPYSMVHCAQKYEDLFKI